MRNEKFAAGQNWEDLFVRSFVCEEKELDWNAWLGKGPSWEEMEHLYSQNWNW